MSVAQRRYNNRKKTNHPITPKPFHNLGYGGRPLEQVTRLVCVCICVCPAHQFHSWVTDGALSLARIGRTAHIPRHAGNAFCDVQLMLTSRRITHQITVRACSLLYALSAMNSSDRACWGRALDQIIVVLCAFFLIIYPHIHASIRYHQHDPFAHLPQGPSYKHASSPGHPKSWPFSSLPPPPPF